MPRNRFSKSPMTATTQAASRCGKACWPRCLSFSSNRAPTIRSSSISAVTGSATTTARCFLAPVDCDPSNPVETAIAVEWFRDQLAACRASFKLLVIDSCHAGSEKGADEEALVSAKDLGEPFRALGDVITLASSTADEKSQIWAEKQQSLYSYWLNQGMKGHADADGDNQVDVDELNKYVYRNVVRTAKRHFSRSQTPVRIVRTGTPGRPGRDGPATAGTQ